MVANPFLRQLGGLRMKMLALSWSPLPLIIKGKSGEEEKAKFAGHLREKWKKFGFLWTDEIPVEPILIDFNRVLYKKLL